MNKTMLPAPAAILHAPASNMEQAVLLRHLAAAQRRCSETIARQAAEIAQLRAETMRMRAVVVIRESEVAWAREDRAALEATIPDLAPRATLARKVTELSRKLQDLMRDKLAPTFGTPLPTPADEGDDAESLSALEASVAAADLVICQTGCLSHGEYWRVQDHCKRTGKTCVMVEQPATFRVMRIHRETRPRQDNSLPETTD